MTALGLLIAAGGMMSIILFGGGTGGYFYFFGGVIIALFSNSWIRSKFKTTDGKRRVLYLTPVFLTALSILVIPVLFLESPLDSEKIDAGLRKSETLINNGDYEDAEKILLELSDKYWEYPEIHQNLSALYLRKGDPDDAYLELMTLQKNADMYFNYGLSFYQKKVYLDALINFEKALLFNPDMFEAYLYAGESCFRMNDYPAAAYFFENAKNQRQNIPEAYYHCAKAELQLMELDKAERNLEIASGLDREGRISNNVNELYEEINYYKSKINM